MMPATSNEMKGSITQVHMRRISEYGRLSLMEVEKKKMNSSATFTGDFAASRHSTQSMRLGAVLADSLISGEIIKGWVLPDRRSSATVVTEDLMSGFHIPGKNQSPRSVWPAA